MPRAPNSSLNHGRLIGVCKGSSGTSERTQPTRKLRWPLGSPPLETMRTSPERPIVDRDRTINSLITRHWQASQDGDGDAEHDIYDPSAILDYPQSSERFRWRDTIQAQRGGHPAERQFAVRRIVGNADLW